MSREPEIPFRLSEATPEMMARLLRMSADWLDNCQLHSSAQLSRRAAQMLTEGGENGEA